MNAELDLDALEREALDAFDAPEPPTDFADRVLEASGGVTAPAPDRSAAGSAVSWVAAAAMALLVSGGTLLAVTQPQLFGAEGSDPGLIAELEERKLIGPTDLVPEVPVAAPMPEDLVERIDQHVASYGANWGTSFNLHGTVLVARDGKVAYEGTYGYASLEKGIKTTSDTRYRIGSLSQQLNAVLALQLVESGRIRLDTKVGELLSEVKGPAGQVSVRQLLAHTSGIPNFTDDPLYEMWSVGPHSREQLLGRFASFPLEAKPGAEFSPSNSNYALLALIAERVTGQPYAQALQERVLQPAGMQSTSAALAAWSDDSTTSGYLFEENEETLVPPEPMPHHSVLLGTADVVSTAYDLMAFDRALREGKLLGDELRSEMATLHAPAYGLGWVVTQREGRTVLSHPGGVDGSNAFIWRDLDDGTLVIALANTEVVDCRELVGALVEMVYGVDPLPHVEHEASWPEADKLPRYVGEWTLSDASFDRYGKAVGDSQLAAIEKVRVELHQGSLRMQVPGHGTKWMHPRDADRFFFKDAAGTTADFSMVGDEARAMTLKRGKMELVYVRK